MKLRFAIYDDDLDGYEFLLKAENIPSRYHIWEDEELYQDLGKGVTLVFEARNSIPFAVGRFLLSNFILLSKYPDSIKELAVEITNSDVKRATNKHCLSLYIFTPRLMGLFEKLNINLYICSC